MAEFLDRLGEELSRAVRTPIDANPAAQPAARRSRLRGMLARRAGSADTPPAFWRTSASAGALAALVAITVAAVAVLAGQPFASRPHGSPSNAAAGPSQRAAGSGAHARKPPLRDHGSGFSYSNGPSSSGSAAAEAAAPQAAPQSPSRRQRGVRRIPAGVKAITIDARDRARHISLQRTLTSHGRLDRIIALVQSLPLAQSDSYHCPADTGRRPVIHMLFRRTATSPPLARLTINAGGCNSVTLRTRGHAQPPLSGAQQATKQLGALLHTKL